MSRSTTALVLLLSASFAFGSVISCPAGLPIGGVRIEVKRKEGSTPLPLAKMNRIEEGDQILYSPVLRPKEKREGKVALTLVAAVPQADAKQDFVILEPKDADKPASWKVPFRPSLVLYVYGPDGLSTRKLRGFLSKDDQLIAQLADYAEKTAQTENVLQALATYDETGRTENLGAALQGFASHYGVDNKIDRSAPLEQQTLAAFRSLNPALAAYDPISPPGPQRISQTAGLATTVAGMFLGSTVGLAAGSTAMALNLKAILLPNTDFRSAFAQQAKEGVTLCGRRDQAPGRSRLAYLWALRLPASGPPSLAVEEPNNIAAGMKSGLLLKASEAEAKLIPRATDWALVTEQGERTPVPAVPVPNGVEVDLSKANVKPGKYALAARWDWDDFRAAGEVHVRPLGAFDQTHLTPESQNALRERSGKQVVTLEGDDFEFVRKVALVKAGDKYAAPVDVPFSLPRGFRRGPQNTLEMQVDTTNLTAGDYHLLLLQEDNKPQTAPVRVVKDPPKIESLPLRLNEGEQEERTVLRGEGLDRIVGLKSNGVELELGQPADDGRSRPVTIKAASDLKEGTTFDIQMGVRDYSAPVVLAKAVSVSGRKPRITDVRLAESSGLGVKMREGELAAGFVTSVFVRVEPASRVSAVAMSCRGSDSRSVSVPVGGERDGVRANIVESGGLFLSFDPGIWPSGCLLEGAVEIPGHGKSSTAQIGRVVRIPQIDGFELTGESLGDGQFAGVLTGRALELIDKTGWDAENGQSVPGLPAPVAGEVNKQSLRIRMTWPSPAPRSPLYIWLRGEKEGRQTTVRY